DLIVGCAPAERAGAASAISETGSELGGALGIAILGSIGTAMYGHAMATGVPHDVPALAAAAAKATLGGAVAVSSGLPAPTAAALLEASRMAFAGAFEVVAAVCAALSLAGAVAALTLLRSVPAATRPTDEARVQSEDAA